MGLLWSTLAIGSKGYIGTGGYYDFWEYTPDGSARISEGAPMEGDESLQKISFQMYPNPAQDHANIQYTLAQSSHIYIKVYDVSGKEIAALLDDNVDQGDHLLLLNTIQFPKGVYLVKMISDFGIENQKLIVQ